MIILNENKNEANEVVQQEVNYLEYVNNHISNVKKAFHNLFLSKLKLLHTTSITNEEFVKAVYEAKDAVNFHDNSKLDEIEFHGYRRKYNPTKYELDLTNNDPTYAEEVNARYDEAWEHHFTVNDHHPKHWKIEDGKFDPNNQPQDMPLSAIIHMICDWQAMSYHYKNDMFEWYEKEADEEKNDLSFNSRKIVEEIFEMIKTIGNTPFTEEK